MSDQQIFSGRYELVRHVARGGMAQVYLAQDVLLDRPVALKVLFPELSVDPSFVERFRREAQAAANLSHPNIVSIYDWGQGERTYFIVMEYIDGATLSQVIRQGTLDAERAAEIGAEVAAALDFAHRRGVIHRDVKPGNVLIDHNGQVKVADFGIARAVGAAEGLTQAGAVMGTATYFSPEQAQGFAVDARSDVYSLGVVLYEMAVGHAPFVGENPLSIAYKHVREEPVPPTTENPEIPASFEAIVLKAMSKEPAARYQSAEELRADLLRFRRGEPVAAEAVPATLMAPVAAAAVAATQVNRTAIAPRADTVAGTPLGAGPAAAVYDEEADRRGLWLALGLLALLALAAAIFFIGRAEGWWGSAKALTIPTNVVGMPAPAAKSELKGLGFTQVGETTRASSKFGAGRVITTNPRPGTSSKANQPVTLVVSSGAAPVTVPNVVGKPVGTAKGILEGAGFAVTTMSQASTSVNQGDVITTNPGPDQTAPKGSTVTLTVSSGKPQVKIPSVFGKNPAAAGQTLGALGLSVVEQSQASSSVPAGEVIGTNPPAGTLVGAGTQVTVLVSTGTPQVGVPRVTGQTQAQAQQTLSNAGLQSNVTTVVVRDPTQDGIVQSQSPGPGATAAQGSTVTIAVGSYTAPSTTTTLPPTPSTTLPSTTTTTPTTVAG
ncbi:MAG: Stk1 family PASTA domain-containing Ser/Thr kinase [Acidimicrobiales bacterium]